MQYLIVYKVFVFSSSSNITVTERASALHDEGELDRGIGE